MIVTDVEHPVIEADDRHHLERARRLRRGDAITVTDGAGRWRWCRFGPEVEPDGEVVVDPAPAPGITVAFALVKGERPELVVQKLTELGVDRITPFLAERSVVRWDSARADRHHDRLVRIAREAAMQSRRTWLPQVVATSTFEDVVGLPGAVAAERGGAPPSLDRPTVLIGPEGGWSDGERARLPGTVALGAGVLRAETAAIAAGVVLTVLREGIVDPRLA